MEQMEIAGMESIERSYQTESKAEWKNKNAQKQNANEMIEELNKQNQILLNTIANQTIVIDFYSIIINNYLEKDHKESEEQLKKIGEMIKQNRSDKEMIREDVKA